MALTQGSLVDYEIFERGMKKAYSNFRGVIAMNLPDFTLKPGKSYTLAWTIFEHDGKTDFMKKLQAKGSAVVKSDKFVYQLGETVNIYLNGSTATTFTADKLGEKRVHIPYGKGKTTHATILVVSNYDSLIARRVSFILDNQQMNDTADARYGAYMV